MKMSETKPVVAFQPIASGVKVHRPDGSALEVYHLYVGHQIGCPKAHAEIQIYVGPDNKIEVHAYKPHRGAEIPLCDGPV